jgi:hypothetical protein
LLARRPNSWPISSAVPDLIVGASLLAIAVCQSIFGLNDELQSRASSLPQEKFPQEKRDHPEPGRLLGRLAVEVDLGRPVNHAGRTQALRSGHPGMDAGIAALGPECVKTSAKNRGARSCVSSGKSRQAFRPGIHVGTRFLGRFLITLTVVRVLTHSGPWMALRGGPTEQCLRSGTPSLGEVPSGGAKAFWLLLRFSKVTRRQGGTISSRYRTNGYTHRPQTLDAPVPGPHQPHPSAPHSPLIHTCTAPVATAKASITRLTPQAQKNV